MSNPELIPIKSSEVAHAINVLIRAIALEGLRDEVVACALSEMSKALRRMGVNVVEMPDVKNNLH